MSKSGMRCAHRHGDASECLGDQATDTLASTSGARTPRASSRLSSDRLPAPVKLPSSHGARRGSSSELVLHGPEECFHDVLERQEADFRAEVA